MLYALVMSGASPLSTSAETSTLAYGVITGGWAAVMPRSVPSHVLAALLAGLLTASLQPVPDATW